MTALEDKHIEQARSKELEAAVPPDEFEEGTVIKFFKQFEEDGQLFTYTALKIGKSKWFTDGNYFTWRTLLFKIDQDNIYDLVGSPDLVQVAQVWVPLADTAY